MFQVLQRESRAREGIATCFAACSRLASLGELLSVTGACHTPIFSKDKVVVDLYFASCLRFLTSIK